MFFGPGFPFFRFLSLVDDGFHRSSRVLLQEVSQADPVVRVAFFQKGSGSFFFYAIEAMEAMGPVGDVASVIQRRREA